MARVANRFYRTERGPHVYLYIDAERVAAPIRYADKGRKYPHIHGRLNREAIVAVRPARRDAGGRFMAPESLDL
jgi:uncharacterized protein (DUF952 family)